MTAYSNAANGGDGGRPNAYVGSVPVEVTLRQTTNASAVSSGVREVQRMEKEYLDGLEKPSISLNAIGREVTQNGASCNQSVVPS